MSACELEKKIAQQAIEITKLRSELLMANAKANTYQQLVQSLQAKEK